MGRDRVRSKLTPGLAQRMFRKQGRLQEYKPEYAEQMERLLRKGSAQHSEVGRAASAHGTDANGPHEAGTGLDAFREFAEQNRGPLEEDELRAAIRPGNVHNGLVRFIAQQINRKPREQVIEEAMALSMAQAPHGVTWDPHEQRREIEQAFEGMLKRDPSLIEKQKDIVAKAKLLGELPLSTKPTGKTELAEPSGSNVADPLDKPASTPPLQRSRDIDAWRPPLLLPKRQWLYAPHYVRKFLSATIGLPGTGKSSLVLAEALAIASGRALLDVEVNEPMRVWYHGEDPKDEIDRRIVAIMKEYNIKADQLGDRLFITSQRDIPITLAVSRPGETRPLSEHLGALKAFIIAKKIDLFILDPLAMVHAVNENDNSAMLILLRALNSIVDECNCAGGLVHHSRKTGGAEVSVEHGRGASALIGAMRSLRVLNAMTEDEAGEFKLSTEMRSHKAYFRVENGKANLTPPAEYADWYEIDSVSIDNGDPNNPADDGDRVGIVRKWDVPERGALTNEQIRKIQAAVRQGGPWRYQPQARDWAGEPIAAALSMDATSPAVRKRLVKVIEECVKRNALSKPVRHDAIARRPVQFIEIAQSWDET